MQHYFHTSSKSVLLFEEWKIETWKGMFVSTLIIFMLTIVYEFCSSYHKYLNYSLNIKQERLARDEQSKISTQYKRFRRHIRSLLFYILQLLFGYVIMLLVMTYQVYILTSVLVGVGFGYFISNPIILRGMDKLYLRELEKVKIENESLNHNGDNVTNRDNETNGDNETNEDNDKSGSRLLVESNA